METLIYYISGTSVYVYKNIISSGAITFNEISWNRIKCVAFKRNVNVTKKIYNFILKLQKLKYLRFRNEHGYLYLITYNSKFFKRKSLLMLMRNKYFDHCTDSKNHIIFIL